MEKVFNTMEENPNREIIMPVWKDYSIEDAIVAKGKKVKAIKPEIINSCQEKKKKTVSDVVYEFTEFITEPIKEVRNEIVDMAKGGVRGVSRVSRNES